MKMEDGKEVCEDTKMRRCDDVELWKMNEDRRRWMKIEGGKC